VATPTVRYYRVDPNALPVWWLWRLARDWKSFSVFVGVKRRRGVWSPPFVQPCPTSWQAVATDRLPDPAESRLASPVEILERAGFRTVGRANIPFPDSGFDQTLCSSLLVSDDGRVGAAATYEQYGGIEDIRVGLTTRFGDGTFGVTVNSKQRLPRPPDWIGEYREGLPAADIVLRHLRNVGR
jgi:hypothetical protein